MKLRLAFLAALAAFQSAAAQATRPQLVSGTVKSDSGGLITSAAIVVTPAGAGDSRSLTGHTNSLGHWSVQFESRSSDYFVTVSAIGWIQVRLTAHSDSTGGPLVVDATMKRAPQVLGPVRITESRRQPAQREFLVGTDVAGTEKGVLAQSEVFAAGDQGDLVAMAAQVPGVTVLSDPNGGPPSFSVLGLSSSQNNVTLNGLAFGGGDIPRDVIGAVRISSSTYDVSRGGFSGAQLSVTELQGGNFVQRIGHVTVDAPDMQATDDVGRELGMQYHNVQLSGVASGPIVLDHVFYNFGVQGGYRYSDLRSLLNTDAFSLQRIGVAQDSVGRLLNILQTNGIPVSAVGNQRQTTNGSALFRFDWQPARVTQATLTGSIRHNEQRDAFVAPTSVPAHGGDQSRDGGDFQGELSQYIHTTILDDLRFGAHSDLTNATPYLNVPNANVLVASEFPDSSTGFSSLAFGGNAGLPRTNRVSGAEVFNQTQWNTVDNKHYLRVTEDARWDGLSQNQVGNLRGTFSYLSLGALQANSPSSFSRSFTSHGIVTSTETGSASIGDFWRPSNTSGVYYGARVDANRFGTALSYNPLVDSLFGKRTDYSPQEVVVSPRAQFNFGFGHNGTTGIPGYGAPWGNLSGGIGEFRNDFRPGQLAGVVSNTGLPGSTQQVTCVGSAVPVPDYQQYLTDPTTIPTTCVGGAGPSFVENQPNVSLIAPGFKAERAWRGNLTLRGPLFTKLIRFNADYQYSVNLNQQSYTDLNFSPIIRDSLVAEGNRPVFVNRASIVSATGVMTNHDSRVSTQLNSVNAVTSDLQGRSGVFTFAFNPVGLSNNVIRWSLTYTHSNIRDQQRGFGGTTAGSPLAVEWGRSSLDFEHAFNVNFSARVSNWFSVALTGRMISGAPFTPIVAGDINGDGLSNDRAFIFNPATVADTSVRTGMNALLSKASPRVQKCLTSQFGTIATRNSCEGPWTATMVGAIRLNPEKLGWDNRAQVSLNFSNPLAGVDELLHGANHMQGWGQQAFPDPTLLQVRGYNPATGTYLYTVNQRFGDTRLATSGLRTPFVMTLEVRAFLSADPDHQNADQIAGPGRTRKGDKLNPQQLRNRLTNSIYNPLQSILQVKDSLSMLSQAQVDRLTQLQRRLVPRQDSIWAPVVAYIDALPADYDQEAVTAKIRDARMRAFDLVIEAMTEASKILTPEQIEDFPPALRSAFDIESLKAIRPTIGFFPNY